MNFYQSSKLIYSIIAIVFLSILFTETIFADINDGLVAFYPFNGDANDHSGNDNHGVVNGAELTTDRFGNSSSAYAFRAEAMDYINVADNTSLQITDTISISVWVRRTRIYGIDNSRDELTTADIILEKGGDWTEGKTNYGISLHTWPSLNYKFYFYFNGGSHGVSGLQDYNWHHYVVVAKNNSKDTKIFIDGILYPIDMIGRDATEVVNMVTTNSDLHIGAQISEWKYYSANIIDEIRIYNRLLLEEEVKNLFNDFHKKCDNLNWKLHNGKEYALTSNYGSWIEAQIESEKCGGNLVTINSLEENTWLINTFFDVYNRSHEGEEMQANVWIGYKFNSQKNKWEWESAEPISYTNIYEKFPQNGSFAYLHISPHPAVGTWNANPTHNDSYNYQPKGIIERTFSGCFSEEHINQAVIIERNKWDANYDGKIGLEEAIKALQITAGID